jgi:signal transduction histidine kinase
MRRADSDHGSMAWWRRFYRPPAGSGDWLRTCQRAAIVRHTPTLVIVMLVNSLLIGAVFWDSAGPWRVAGWTSAVWLASALAWASARAARRRGLQRIPSANFLPRAVLRMLFPGAIWGSTALVFFAPGHFDLQLVLVFVLAGMSAGVVASGASVPPVALAFVLPALLPLTAQFLLHGSRASIAMGALSLVYIVALAALLRIGHEAFHDMVAAGERAHTAEERLRESCEAVGDGLVVFDAALRVVVHNSRYLEICPHLRSFPSIVGMSYAEIVRAGVAAKFYDWDQTVAADPEAWIRRRVEWLRTAPPVPVRIVFSSGRTFLLRLQRLPDGGCAQTLTDITEASLAERRLAEVIESIGDGFVLYDPAGRVVMHNRRFLELYSCYKALPTVIGLSFEELGRIAIGADFFPEAQPAQSAGDWITEQRAKFSREFGAPIERRLAGGRTIMVHRRGLADGSIASVFTDVTDLKRAEARLADAVETMSDGFALYDAGGRIVLHNRRFIDLHAFLKGEPVVVGRTLEELCRIGIAKGAIREPLAARDPEAWIRQRLAQFASPPEAPIERRLENGSTVLIHERKLADGCTVSIGTDVTALKRAEARLADAVESMPDSFVLYDAAGRVSLHNRRFVEFNPYLDALPSIAGMHVEEIWRLGLQARGYNEPLSLNEPESWLERRRAMFDHPSEQPIERRMAGGRSVLIHERKLADGSTVSIGTDVTDLKRAEARLVDAIESMPNGFVLYDKSGRIVLHNRRFVEFNPYVKTLPSIVGMTVEEICRIGLKAGAFGDPLAQSDPEAWLKRRLEFFANPPDQPIERRLASGMTILIHERKLADGSTVSIGADVTDVKRAEARLADAIESMSDGFVLWDAEDRLVMHNSAYAKMFEGVPDAFAVGKRFAEIAESGIRSGAFPAAAGRERDYLKERLAWRQAPGTAVVHPFKDGRWLRLVERRTAEGGIVGLRSDVTAEVKREHALRESQRELATRIEELEAMQHRLETQHGELNALYTEVSRARDAADAGNAAKSVFLANMSHELRTPLNAIIGFAEVMDSGLFGEIENARYKNYNSDILAAARHLLRLINDVLDLSKIEAGKWEISEEPVDVEALLKSVRRLIGGRDEMAALTLRVDAVRALPPILADERALKQILINLLSNAIKFTPSGGTVRLRARRGRGGRVQFVVADSGIGMRREDLPTALQPFGQIDNFLTRRQQGTGLGLSIAKALVELHGGSLRLRSRPGRGTTIVVTLPVERCLVRSPRAA